MKNPTDWSKNSSNEANAFNYDDSTVVYDSATNNYDGVVDTDMSDRDILPTSWETETKTVTAWSEPTKTPTAWSMA